MSRNKISKRNLSISQSPKSSPQPGKKKCKLFVSPNIYYFSFEDIGSFFSLYQKCSSVTEPSVSNSILGHCPLVKNDTNMPPIENNYLVSKSPRLSYWRVKSEEWRLLYVAYIEYSPKILYVLLLILLTIKATHHIKSWNVLITINNALFHQTIDLRKI